MKKLLLVIVSVLLCTKVFALGTYNSIGLHFSVPVLFEKTENNSIEQKLTMTSIAFGLDAMTLFSEKIGIFANLDISFPQKIHTERTRRGKTETYTFDRSDYDSLWGISLMAGPAFAIIRTDRTLFTVSPGLHYKMLSAKVASYSNSSYAFGIGANIQDSISIGDKGCFLFGCDLIYDFYGTPVIDGNSDSDRISDFTFKPFVGFGIRL